MLPTLRIFLPFFLLIFAFEAQGAELKVGQMAPNFKAKESSGKEISLSDFSGKTVVLYFYPKDGTPGCTLEAKGFRELFPEFQKKNTVIIGVSYDGLASHQDFKKTYKIPYYLLVDEDQQIAGAYGTQGRFFAVRQTFIIGPDGRIKNIYRNVDPSGHAKEILEDLQDLEEPPPPKAP